MCDESDKKQPDLSEEERVEAVGKALFKLFGCAFFLGVASSSGLYAWLFYEGMK